MTDAAERLEDESLGACEAAVDDAIQAAGGDPRAAVWALLIQPRRARGGEGAGARDGMKSIRECRREYELEMETLVSMTFFVGLDVSTKETAICVIDDAGERVWEGKSRSVRNDATGSSRLLSEPLDHATPASAIRL